MRKRYKQSRALVPTIILVARGDWNHVVARVDGVGDGGGGGGGVDSHGASCASLMTDIVHLFSLVYVLSEMATKCLSSGTGTPSCSQDRRCETGQLWNERVPNATVGVHGPACRNGRTDYPKYASRLHYVVAPCISHTK